jgi:hypothetical protein
MQVRNTHSLVCRQLGAHCWHFTASAVRRHKLTCSGKALLMVTITRLPTRNSHCMSLQPASMHDTAATTIAHQKLATFCATFTGWNPNSYYCHYVRPTANMRFAWFTCFACLVSGIEPAVAL